MALDTTGLATDLKDVWSSLRASGSLTPDEVADGEKWTVGYGIAIASGDATKAHNYEVALNGLFGAVEFRESEAGRKALLHGLTIAAEWMLKAGVAALAG